MIDNEWATTGGTNLVDFLLCDNRLRNGSRVVVFSSPQQLRHLALATTWFMDGNFSMALRLFSQLYVIRAPLGEAAVTCAYAFLTGEL